MENPAGGRNIPPRRLAREYGSGRLGNQARPRRRPELIGDDAQLLPLRSEPQHGAKEVPAARGVDPTRAKNDMAPARRRDSLFAGKLARTVDVERIAEIGL